jgi:cation:H+ antiporter
VRSSAIFTAAIAILPLLLMLDGALSRADGLILLGSFIFYIFWLFSKKERFKKIYTDGNGVPLVKEFKVFIKDLGKLIVALVFLLLAAEGMVRSSIYFVDLFKVSLPVIGILLVGLGNALPETYFAVVAARKEENWSVLGNLMGTVIVAGTLVLGIVALFSPIKISELSLFSLARIFLLISAIFFLFIIRTGQKITKKEAIILLSIYIIFVVAEIIVS